MVLAMAKIQIERRTVTRKSLSHDIARHIYARQWHGKAVVVCDNPKALTSSVMKQWIQLTNKVRRDRASTLNADKIRELSRALSRMEHFRMTTKYSDATSEYEVLFITPDDIDLIPHHCRTIYVACDDTQETTYAITQRNAHVGLLVCY
jgi:hypothetical protein